MRLDLLFDLSFDSFHPGSFQQVLVCTKTVILDKTNSLSQLAVNFPLTLQKGFELLLELVLEVEEDIRLIVVIQGVLHHSPVFQGLLY